MLNVAQVGVLTRQLIRDAFVLRMLRRQNQVWMVAELPQVLQRLKDRKLGYSAVTTESNTMQQPTQIWSRRKIMEGDLDLKFYCNILWNDKREGNQLLLIF